MAISAEPPKALIKLLDRFHSDLEPHVLTNINEITDPSAPVRKGSDGKIIDLVWKGKHCVGKELHEIFFEFGTDVQGMTTMFEKFSKEIKVMSKLKHDNIVPFLGIYYKQLQSVAVALPVLVMERMEYSLTKYIETTHKGVISDEKIAQILCDVAKGLVYLHEGCREPLAHRDLSSNNILLTSTFCAKIADFGSARVLDRLGGWNSSAKLTKVPGTQIFMPPETWENPPNYTTAVDIFSFGCIIIHLVTWQWPTPDGQICWGKSFLGKEVRQIVSELDRWQKWIAMFKEYHPLLPIVKQCLQDKINKRPKCSELLSLCEIVLRKHEKALRQRGT